MRPSQLVSSASNAVISRTESTSSSRRSFRMCSANALSMRRFPDGESDHPGAAILRAATAGHEPGLLQRVDAFGHRAGGDHRELGELPGCSLVGCPGPAQCGEHVELSLGQAVSAVDDAELVGQVRRDAVQAADDALGRDVKVGAFAGPLLLDASDTVEFGHNPTLAPSR